MPGAARRYDMCSGHGCFPPRITRNGSSDVIVNGRGWHRQLDGWDIHCCKKNCHPGILRSGSKTVIVNGRQAGRIFDPISCGSVVKTGSTDVIVGG